MYIGSSRLSEPRSGFLSLDPAFQMPNPTFSVGPHRGPEPSWSIMGPVEAQSVHGAHGHRKGPTPSWSS